MTPVSVPATCPLRYQLWIMLRRLRVGILTTRSPKGLMTSRPLLTANGKHDVGRVLRFFVSADHLWVRDIALDANVSVVYADVNQAQFVAVSGSARLMRNLSMQQSLWTPWAQRNFPDGPHDPMLRILEVDIELAVLHNGNERHELTLEEFDTAPASESVRAGHEIRRPLAATSGAQSRSVDLP